MMLKADDRREREEAVAGLMQRPSEAAFNPHAVMLRCWLFIAFLLLLAPNISSAAMPTVETLPPIVVTMPSGVAVGDDETIYVASSTENWVRIFNKSGQYQSSITGFDGDGPTAVAVDAAGQIYIGNGGASETGVGNVEVYNSAHVAIGKLGSGNGEFTTPIGIAIDSAGLIYVVDGRDHVVRVYNADHSFRFSFGSIGTGDGQFQTPTSIAINEVTSEILIPDLTAVSTSARVQVFDFNGIFLRSFITTGTNNEGETVTFRLPYGVAVDTLDRIYITDGYQNVVTVYDPLGNPLGKLYDEARPLRTPQGIAFAPASSRLFITSPLTNTIETRGIDSVYGNIAITPQSHDFGSITVNETSASQRFAVSNNGSGDLAISAVSLTGAAASEFLIISNNCTAITLAPTAGCVVDVAFKPLSVASKSASLSIASDDLYVPELDVELTGSVDPQYYQLAVTKGGAGSGNVQGSGIDCGATCINEYVDGTLVSLSAMPDGGSLFAGWSGGGCSETGACSVTMGQAVAVTAIFDINPVPPVTYTITASAGANGSITPAGATEANENSTVTFAIAADAEYQIADVLVDGGSVGPVDTYSFPDLSADHTIAAEFTTIHNFLLSSIEMGEVSVGDAWKQVTLSSTFVDPVVVAKPASLNDATPAVIRVRNVGAQGFELRIQEWNYLLDLEDNTLDHVEEQVSYIVMERGSHTLDDGTRIEAGQFDTDVSSSFISVGFAQTFEAPPVVISSIVTYNDDIPVIGRMTDVDVTGFGYKLQEEQENNQTHATESVSFIAWEPSQGSQDGISFEVAAVDNVQSQQTTPVTFGSSYLNQPLFIADLQTTNGSVVNLRWSDSSATGISVLVDHEQSTNSLRVNVWGQQPLPLVPSIEALGYLVLWSADLRPHTLTVEMSGLGSGQVQARGIDCGTDCSEAFSEGALVTLSAVAAEGSVFAGWSDNGCSGTESCVVTLTQATTVTVIFNEIAPPTYTLSIAKDGIGSGQVLAQGIDCGLDCEELYNEGALIVLSAVAADGSVFAGWSGGGCSGTDSCMVTVTQETTVTALFDEAPPAVYSLSVVNTGLGSGWVVALGIDCGADCSEDYDEGTSVTLSATADDGSIFVGWSGGGCSGIADCNLTMDQSISVTAVFNVVVPPSYTLTVAIAGSGSGQVQAQGISCGADCDETYNEDDSIILTAVAADGSLFAGWSGGGCSGMGDCIVIMNQAVTVTAQFDEVVIPTYTLTVVKEGTGGGQVQAQGINCGADCGENYDEGTSVTLSAAADDGSVFAGWSGGGCGGTGSCVVTVDQSTTVIAAFNEVAPPSYTLSITLSGLGSGQVQGQGISCGADCEESYSDGAVAALSATAADGSLFAGWSGGSCSGSDGCVVTMTQATTVTAQFDEVVIPTHTLTVVKGGTGGGQVQAQGINCGADCGENYDEGTSVTLSAAADDGSVFAGWSGGGCSGTESCNLTMAQSTTMMAIFNEVVLPTYTLTVVIAAGSGSGQVAAQGINCGTDCEETYSEGNLVTLTAVAADGSFFAGWSGDSCNGTEGCIVTMDQAVTVSAQFDEVVIPTYVLSVAKEGSGSGRVQGEGIDCGADCSEAYSDGTVVVLSAVADEGSDFAGWSGGLCSGMGRCEATVNQVARITALFNETVVLTYQFTVIKEGNGSGRVQGQGIDCGGDCDEIYSEGVLVTLSAEADSGSGFVGWSGSGCSGTASCVVTINQASTVTASFNADAVPVVTYTVTVGAETNGSVSSASGNTANMGSTLTYSIVANSGYRTVDVMVDGASVGVVDSYSFENIMSVHTISATFAANDFNLSTVVMGEVAVGHDWVQVEFGRVFSDAVVVAKPASLNDASPAVVRISDVGTKGFKIRIQEWDYLDGEHAEEQVSYIVMERGSHALVDGTRIEAGGFNTSNAEAFGAVRFANTFAVTPVVVASIVSVEEADAVVGRIKDVSVTGFQYMLQEQTTNAIGHAAERVSYIAWEPSLGQQDEVSFEVSNLANAQTQKNNYIYFGNSYMEVPLFFADLQTTDSIHAANLRWEEKDSTAVSVLIDQEASSVAATSSSSEVVGYLVLSGQVDLTCDLTTDADCDCLSDDDERDKYGTDPTLADTDGDGLPDGIEVIFWLGEGWRSDGDGDGLINLLDYDSDNDGRSDGYGIDAGEGCGSSGSGSTGSAGDLFNQRDFGFGASRFNQRGRSRTTFEERGAFESLDRSFEGRSDFRSPVRGFDRSGVSFD